MQEKIAIPKSQDDVPSLGQYKMTAAVPGGGVRVRKTPSLKAEKVATIEWGTHADNTITVTKIRSVRGVQWLKLAPAMYGSLMLSDEFKPHNPAEEGWVFFRRSSS